MVKDLLEERARGLGRLFAWAPLDLPQEAEAGHRAWLEAGRNGGMAYLEAPERFHPRKRLPWAKSALLLFAPYAYPDPGTPPGGLRVGRVARYAWTRDYHLVLGEALKALEETARGLGLKAKGYVDHGPLPERTLAALSGAGWIGKSGYFLSQAFGVHAFIGVLLTPLEAEAAPLHPSRCGRCARCLTACPTEALLGDATLDARGWDPSRAAREMGPPARRDFFRLSGRAFGRKYAGTAFLRAGRARMARNALIVLFNLGLGEALFLEATRDPNPLVRRTALKALHLMGKPLDPFLQDPGLREEALALLGEAPEAVHLLQDGREAPGPEVKEQGA